MKRLLISLMSALLLMILTGCITTRNSNTADNPFPDRESFKRKTVAILPVKSQTSLTTDSQTPLKKALNKKIQEASLARFHGATVIGAQTSLDVLNDAGKLDVFEKLVTGYDNTGAFDKKLLSSLCSTLKSDYLLLSKLKNEQMNIVIARTFVSSFEIFLLSKDRSEPVWSGLGDFKRSGIYGAGGTETDEAAAELVTLAFGETAPTSQPNNETAIKKPTSEDPPKVAKEELVAAHQEAPVAQIAEKKSGPSIGNQNPPPSSASMVVITSKAKLRKSPSAKATVIKTLKRGEEVQVIKEKNGWCLIELAGGETGWCLKGALAQRN